MFSMLFLSLVHAWAAENPDIDVVVNLWHVRRWRQSEASLTCEIGGLGYTIDFHDDHEGR